MAADRLHLAFAFLVLGLAACSESGADFAGASAPFPSSAGAGQTPGGDVAQPTESDAGVPLPPEKELDQSFRAPVATGRVLWSANPDSGRVALIDAKTLAVRMTNAGFGPTYLAAVPSKPGTDSAIVLNVGSHDATLFAASGTGIDSVTIPTHIGANAWSVSGDGTFAIAWTDVTQIDPAPADSVNGYSELTVIDLTASPPVGTRLSVGFRPSRVVFDRAARHAFAVVDEGISVIDLAGRPALSRLVAVSSSVDAHARDVNIASDGSFAVVRVDGQSAVEIIDLDSEHRTSLDLGSNVTDLDLSPDGSTATAVLGDATPPAVVSFPVPNPGADTTAFTRATVEGELVRSVTLAPNGELAVLYANAVPSSHVTLLERVTFAGSATPHFQYRTVDVQGAVQSVYVSPDSSAAITFQNPPAGSTKKGLFSIVPTQGTRSPRIVGTDARPADIAFSDANLGKALVTVHDSSSAVRGVYVLGLANLEQNFVPLSSEPLPGATGIVPLVHRGFVAQKHPEGRITFVDLDSGVAQTLSGFEIAARVVQ